MKKTTEEFREWLGLKIGDKVKIKNYGEFKITKNRIIDDRGCDFTFAWLVDEDYEIIRPILDDIEKRYLENILRPFKNKKDIRIAKYNTYLGSEWLNISTEEMELSFPAFSKNSMYIGMELKKEYTMDELGLFKK